MANDQDLDPEPDGEGLAGRRRRRWAKRLGWLIAILVAPVLLAAAFFSTPIGKRFITDQIAAVAPASGLRFQVGRIEGDIYGQAVLHDVVVSDPRGVFLTIPEVVLDWRPLKWLWSGLDVRELTARRGRLQRLPELLPGDPDAPLLPDFDIRVDRLAIEDLVIAPGVATPDAHRANLIAQVDIRDGRVLVDADGRFGQRDRIALLLDAEPDGDRFDLAFNYVAPQGGVLSGLAGLDSGYVARVVGDGTWSRWRGTAVARRWSESPQAGGSTRAVAAFQISNDAGLYGLLGQVRPVVIEDGLIARALGEVVSITARFQLDDSIAEGRAAAVSRALGFRAAGVVDLADNLVEGARVGLRLRDPELFGEQFRLEEAELAADVAGAFRDLAIDHRLIASRLVASGVAVSGLEQQGLARYDGENLVVPLTLTADRVTTGNQVADPRLVNGRLSGRLVYDLERQRLLADGARLTFPGLRATLTLRGDVGAGAYALTGPLRAERLAIESVGQLTADARILARFGPSVPWSLRANIDGVLTAVTNETFATIAGQRIRFSGALGMGAGQPIMLRDVEIDSPRLTARLDSRVQPGTNGTRTTLAGRGRHTEYGPFSFDAEISGDGPRAVLVLADPYPAAGLEDVRIAIAPSVDGFALDVSGGSLLGPFDGAVELVLPDQGPARLAIQQLEVYRTNVSGGLVFADAGLSGDLVLTGGGVNGDVRFAPAGNDAVAFAVDLAVRNASFGGDRRITLSRAQIDASGQFGGREGLRIDGDVSGTGLQYGQLYLANFTAAAQIANGSGGVTGAIAGSRADRFALKYDADVAPGRLGLLARGEYGGSAITMPRRAILTEQGDGGWRLAPTQLGFGSGYAIFSGQLGGDETALEAKLARMPLRLLDIAGAELGIGGRLSGIVEYRDGPAGSPTANARIRIERFSRAGLVLSSRPVNVLGVIDLAENRLTAAGRLFEGEERRGDITARISGLGPGDDLVRRLMNGRLDARLVFDGPAETLWRLAAIETFDLTGPIAVALRAQGTLAAPRIDGTLASDGLTVQSALSGTRVDRISARGRFAGSRLELTRFSGATRGNGSLTGSGTVDLAGLSADRGPRLDLRASARNARLLDANGLQATVTGPLRIVSDGVGGTIAGRVRIDRARWSLGRAAPDAALPRIATTEINGENRGPARRSGRDAVWRYLVNASAPSRVAVDGLGLDSEWGVDIALRGTVEDPRIGGSARLVRGDYTFAGTRFELTRGRIQFDQNVPIDPRLDILAETSTSGTDVNIAITGNAQSPSIAFSSEPALPEEEILARLLFGGSVTSLSATDAVQLAAAIAALQGGGGGLDPIGELRESIGLDQLRIVSADPLIGRGTGIALGKNIGRRIYVELVTDGRGYSATQVEYRITSWLALLGTVSTIGRDSILAEISRDY